MAATNLPQRTTRGNRYRSLLSKEDLDEEQAEDKEFWQQEFFQEEVKDDAYITESEPSDVFSSDFEDTEDEDDEEVQEDGDAREKKKSALKPPGHKKVAGSKAAGKAAAKARKSSTAEKRARAAVRLVPVEEGADEGETEGGDGVPAVYEAPSLRRSTRERVAEAEEERRIKEKSQVKRKRPTAPTEQRLLTQEELLAEAAQTEIENSKSLQLLVAYEEETKRQANLEKEGLIGPRLRYRSCIKNGQVLTTWSSVECDEVDEAEMYELAAHTAPAPPQPQACIITGQPAHFRDPSSGMPYADLAAFKELRMRLAAGTLILQPRAAKLAALAH